MVHRSQPAPTTLLEPPRRSPVSSCQGPPSLTRFPGSCGSGGGGGGRSAQPWVSCQVRQLWGQMQQPLASLLPAFAPG